MPGGRDDACGVRRGGVVPKVGLGGGETVVAEHEADDLQSAALAVEQAGQRLRRSVRSQASDVDEHSTVVGDGARPFQPMAVGYSVGVRCQRRCRPRSAAGDGKLADRSRPWAATVSRTTP